MISRISVVRILPILSLLLFFPPQLSASEFSYSGELSVLPDAPMPFATDGEYGGNIEFLWNKEAKVFDHFLMQFGTWPSSATFGDFVYITPGWNRAGSDVWLVPLPFAAVGPDFESSGFSFDGSNASFRLDGWTLESAEVPAYLSTLVADCLDAQNVAVIVFNQNISCNGCAVVDGGSLNDGSLLMRADLTKVFLDSFEEGELPGC